MRRLIHVLLPLLVAVASASPAAAQQQASSVVTVLGEASVRAAPDLAMLRAGVTTTAKTAREASEVNAKAMTAVIGALQAAGIAPADIQTARIALQPILESPNGRGSPRITSFHTSNTVSVRITDLGKVAEIIDSAVASGANEIGGVEFMFSDPGKLLDAARGEALGDARRKAELYAKAANAGLGRIIGISEAGDVAEPMVMMRASPQASTPVMPGERTLRLSVTVSYQIVP